MQSKQSLGGQSSAIIQRQRAIENYYKNPNYCQNPVCGKLIEVVDGVKVSQIKIKKFCCHSCAAITNNKNLPKRIKVKIKNVIISKIFHFSDCTCHNKSKQELFDTSANWQSARTAIRKHASLVFRDSKQPYSCKICGYTNHIEICHIKSVSSFDGSTIIADINNISNLVPLCPNHHWEFDNGILSL